MALIRCPECGHEVSTSAATCPNCGRQLKSSNKLLLLSVVLAIILSGVAGLLYWVQPLPQKSPKPTTNSVKFTKSTKSTKSKKPRLYYLKRFHTASINLEWYKQAEEMVALDDMDAYGEMYRSKKVFVIKDGIPVYLLETNQSEGWIKIRPKGSTSIFYTSINCIDQDNPLAGKPHPDKRETWRHLTENLNK